MHLWLILACTCKRSENLGIFSVSLSFLMILFSPYSFEQMARPCSSLSPPSAGCGRPLEQYPRQNHGKMVTKSLSLESLLLVLRFPHSLTSHLQQLFDPIHEYAATNLHGKLWCQSAGQIAWAQTSPVSYQLQKWAWDLAFLRPDPGSLWLRQLQILQTGLARPLGLLLSLHRLVYSSIIRWESTVPSVSLLLCFSVSLTKPCGILSDEKPLYQSTKAGQARRLGVSFSEIDGHHHLSWPWLILWEQLWQVSGKVHLEKTASGQSSCSRADLLGVAGIIAGKIASGDHCKWKWARARLSSSHVQNFEPFNEPLWSTHHRNTTQIFGWRHLLQKAAEIPHLWPTNHSCRLRNLRQSLFSLHVPYGDQLLSCRLFRQTLYAL